jgi:uncharacterized Tic20 family protein
MTADAPTASERGTAVRAHLSMLACAVVSAWLVHGVPYLHFAGGWGAFAGPLTVWLLHRDDLPWIHAHAREALDFSLGYSAVSLVLAPLAAYAFGPLGLIYAAPVMIIVNAGMFVLCVTAAIKAHFGEGFRYPLSIRRVR